MRKTSLFVAFLLSVSFLMAPVFAAEPSAALPTTSIVIEHLKWGELAAEIQKAAVAVKPGDIVSVEINAKDKLSGNAEKGDWMALRKLNDTFPKASGLKLSGAGVKVIPANAGSVYSYLFIPWLCSLTLDGVERIEKEAFALCKNLETIDFGRSLDFIGERAFERCEKLTKVEFPASLKTLCPGSFSSAAKIEYIRFNGPPPFLSFDDEWKGTCFSADTRAALIVPQGQKAAYEILRSACGLYYGYYETETQSTITTPYGDLKFRMPVLKKAYHPIYEGNYFFIAISYDKDQFDGVWPKAAKLGETVTLSTSLVKGGQRVKWTVLSPADLVITNNSFVMPQGDVSIKAEFVK